MSDLPERILYEGVSVEITFAADKPNFGDLLALCGRPKPQFSASRTLNFGSLASLNFRPIDDYFGIRSDQDHGVVLWLYPLIGGLPVYHSEGPFDGFRLDYNILRNPAQHAELFLRCVQSFSEKATGVMYQSRATKLFLPNDLAVLRADIEMAIRMWADEGVVVGSNAAMEIDF